ncbi:MAG: kynureninase [Saprospiraceae bacterium]|nr:kynureninase [Saprospiraceae bacterium]
MNYVNSLEYAQNLDNADALAGFRQRFIFPQHEGQPALYFCGNSLGLQPDTVRAALHAELDQWGTYGVEGHFRGEHPWMHYHKFLTPQAARLVGALPHEVVIMNTLTVNLHLMMVSFYRPVRGGKYKIMMEAGAFPSDQYAVETQVRWHGFDPDDAIIELQGASGREEALKTEDIIEAIEREADQLALIMFGGVNYYTGQLYDLERIAATARKFGVCVGFDLAHAAGNVPLQLHDWGPDFAVWCSYKYLNSGPGGPSGCFVHERHANNPDLPRFGGWWGHDESERFQMRKGFKPMRGAEGWQLSNAQIFSFAAHKASLDLFDAAGMPALRAKSLLLSGFMRHILEEVNEQYGFCKIITPANPDQCGCQISLLTDERGREIFKYLEENGAISDWREPNVIRLAPVPLYNSFEDVWKLGQLFLSFFERQK